MLLHHLPHLPCPSPLQPLVKIGSDVAPGTFDRTPAACATLPPAPVRLTSGKDRRPPACAPIPAHTKNRPACRFFGGRRRSAPAPSRLRRVSLSVVAVLLGDLVGVPGQPGQLPHRFIPGQEQIRPSALRPANTYQCQPGIRQRLPQLLTRRRRHVTHSTAPHHTTLTREADREVRPRIPATPRAVHHTPTTSLRPDERGTGELVAGEPTGQAPNPPGQKQHSHSNA
ncbi:conserved hypothetical protein (plasmid) [Rhodococcus jostii RHA1]|uniref:Uncharacterized protein n=1 Tax=Rhodococcus jostii (strain RHA1) TaxID=101510 RepID=Q0RY74_RHOJR|nr:conserved hypothetical protein [Rhodococcus jostii RHA1]